MTSIRVRPRLLGHRVLIQPLEEHSGLVLPAGAAADTLATGIVVACGPGKFIEGTGQLRPMNVKVGDRVLFNHNAGVWIRLDGQQVNMSTDDNIGLVWDEVEEEKTSA